MSIQRIASEPRPFSGLPGPPQRQLGAAGGCAAPWRTLAILPLLFALRQPGIAQAQPLPAPAAPHGQPAQQVVADEQLILTVRANGVVRGEFALMRKADGDYWVLAEDMPRLTLEPVGSARRTAGSDTYYSFRALGATALVYDEAALSLQIEFAVAHLEGTEIDLASRPPPATLTDPGRSLILSYRLAASDSGGATPRQLSVDTDLNVRLGPVLLRQETRLVVVGSRRQLSRGNTQAIWDDRRTGNRVIVGDVVSSAGSYGSTITGGGVLLMKLYEMTPDVITQPTATLRASTNLPAEVVVSVDGSPIYRTNVGPGPITLNNLLLYGGTRNVRVTITDASGRRQVIEQPFLFTDSVLAEGLHEYRYFMGRRSELGAGNEWRYREGAWQALHRYGLSDHLTVSAGGEGNQDFANGGAGATLRSDRLGLFSLDLLASRDRRRQTQAHGWSARYSYVAPLGALQLARRRFGNGFRTFLTSDLNPFLREETRVGVSTRLGDVTVGADLVRSVDARDTIDTGTVRLATTVARGTTLSAEYQATRAGGRNEWSAYVFLRMDLEKDYWAGTSVRSNAGFRTVDVEAGKLLSQGEGVGYRVGTSTTFQQGAGSSSAGFAAANWNLRPATLEFFGSSGLGSNRSRYAEVAVSGAIVGVDGYWGLTRRATDGFVVARLGVPQPGVEVSLNNQVQATTDEDGLAFIPDVGSFGRQDISVNDRQLGMQYQLERRRQTIAPAYRSGSVVDFGGKKLRAVAGMAWTLAGARRMPIASRSWTLSGPAGSLAVETGPAGDFYLEDAPSGRYTGVLKTRTASTTCRLDVPEFAEAVYELKEGIICE